MEDSCCARTTLWTNFFLGQISMQLWAVNELLKPLNMFFLTEVGVFRVQVEMATGGSGLLGDNDDATDKLLWRISICVDPNKLEEFAIVALEMKEIDLNFIKADVQNPKIRNFKTLKKWYESSPYVKVGHLMERLVAWQQDGYLGNNVWSEIDNIVKPEVIQEVVQLVVPTPSSGSKLCYSLKSIREVQRQLRISLRRRCKNYLSTDWLPTDKAKFFPIRDYFVGLQQRKKVLKARKETAMELKKIHDILDIEVEEGGVSIAIRGAAGIGKSSSMAILASDWVERKIDSKLNKFAFVFLVELKNVKNNSTLEQIVIDQHKLREIPEAQIKTHLLGVSGKPLLLLDGYDEYKNGTNTDIDNAIENNVGDCFLVVTSREGDHMNRATLAQIDGEIEITGFSQDNIEIYAEKFLEDEALAKEFIEGCEKSRISGFLRVPILLLITLVLFDENKEDLPISLSEIVRKIAFLMVDRGTKKHFGGQSWEELRLEELLKRFGKLCLDTLINRSYFLQKEDIVEISPVLLKLGLVHGEFLEGARLKGQSEMMSFPHRMFQEFWVAYHALKYVDQSLVKDDWGFDLLQASMRGVTTFLYGLATDKHLVLGKTCYLTLEDLDGENLHQLHPLLQSLADDEPSAKINPLCNYVICSMNSYKPHSSFRSAFYFFHEQCSVDWKDPVNIEKNYDEGCIIRMRYQTDDCASELLRNFALHRIPITFIRLFGKASGQVRQSTVEEKSELNFVDDLMIRLKGCNMKHNSIKLIVSSIQPKEKIDDIILSDCVNVPGNFFNRLAKVSQLKQLRITGGASVNSSEEIGKLLEKQKSLELFDFSSEPIQDETLLSKEEKATVVLAAINCQLRYLIFFQTNLSNILADVAPRFRGESSHLKYCVFNYAQLTERDILGLEKMIQRNQLPALQELYLQGNNFSSCKLALERLFGTIDEKLENCEVIVRPQDLGRTNRSFKCLKIQIGPTVLNKNDFRFHINP